MSILAEVMIEGATAARAFGDHDFAAVAGQKVDGGFVDLGR